MKHFLLATATDFGYLNGTGRNNATTGTWSDVYHGVMIMGRDLHHILLVATITVAILSFIFLGLYVQYAANGDVKSALKTRLGMILLGLLGVSGTGTIVQAVIDFASTM